MSSAKISKIHRTSHKLRDYYKAMHNPQMSIYGTNIYNFEYKWQGADILIIRGG
jgi:hypothetical protein